MKFRKFLFIVQALLTMWLFEYSLNYLIMDDHVKQNSELQENPIITFWYANRALVQGSYDVTWDRGK